MIETAIKKYDIKDMRKILIDFPRQVREAVSIGEAVICPIDGTTIKNVVISGLGGSAIGGDVLRAFTAESIKVPVAVNRHYYLPAYVDESTLVVVASYSGNTEETMSVYKDAVKRNAQILSISSNGTLAKYSRRNEHALITIPPGYPPRTALGYSFFPVLLTMHALGLIPNPNREILETIDILKAGAVKYSTFTEEENPALALAHKLHGKLPVIYSAADRFDVVNLRWRGQIAENAKVLAFGNVYPEMNHNELVGWSQRFHDGKTIRKQMKDMAVVFLRDQDDHKRIKLRMDLSRDIIGECAGELIDVHSEGKSLLARMFSLIYLGDWVSYYLAILNYVDPTPVAVIDYLKTELEKV